MKPGGDKTLPGPRDGDLHLDRRRRAPGAPSRPGATGVGFSLGGAELELGDHAISDQLRVARAAPKRPLMSVWMQHMHGCFEAPEKL